ncbi:uncharacterized protein LOC124926319 [Impatiens glandulifera]|uniref:uncharacterized protein LOC124926319 n=1 Tax=Impatiens glandulifera TaxID=253017 RepID=UPI001FB17F19|nr:uncharacterized protein LOC124926319 [Impatiens glandulifera]
MGPLHLDTPTLLRLFSRYLTGKALRWYLRNRISRCTTIKELGDAFAERYKMFISQEITERDLKYIKQGEKETLESFLNRWRAVVSDIDTPPSEQAQIDLMLENLNDVYNNELASHIFTSMVTLIKTGKNVDRSKARLKNKAVSSYPPSRSYPVPKPRAPATHYVAGTWASSEVKMEGPKEHVPLAPPRYPANTSRNAPNHTITFPSRQYDDLGMPLSKALEVVMSQKLVTPLTPRLGREIAGKHPKDFCEYHQAHDHETNHCYALRAKLQDLIDAGIMAKPNVVKNPLPNHRVNVIETFEDSFSADFLLSLIHADPMEIAMVSSNAKQKNKKVSAASVVPWDYAAEKATPVISAMVGPRAWEVVPKLSNAPDAIASPLFPLSKKQHIRSDKVARPWVILSTNNNLLREDASVNLTRSGVDYRAPFIKAMDANKQKEAEKEKDVRRPTNATAQVPPPNSILAQLKKTNANISLWELLMYSIDHRQALLSELSKKSVSFDTTPTEVVAMMSTHASCCTITFDDSDLPSWGPSHAKALYISIYLEENVVPLSLIDNESALNICPWRTLARIGVTKDRLLPSDLCVRGFDSSEREVMGNLKTIIKVANIPFEIEFVVLNIQPSYNLILRRPWLHQAKAVASTLYQKLKFMHQGQTIVVNGENCTTVGMTSSYITQEVELNGF